MVFIDPLSRMFFALVSRLALCGLALLGVAACSGLGTSPAPLINYQPEAFDASSHVRQFAASSASACEAARRALLSQGYVVASEKPEWISGRKYFQPHPEHHVQLEFRVVCASAGEGANGPRSMIFVSGLKDQYVVRKAKESASLGVGGLGSLSLPIVGGMESMVKVASETVMDAGLYERFFSLLQTHLSQAAPAPAPLPGATGLLDVPQAEPAFAPLAPPGTPAVSASPAAQAR